MKKVVQLLCLMLVWGLFTALGAYADEGPDRLYREGRFAEAEKAYAGLDMDHPRDARYRYNKGCAAYQKGDFKGAGAAFSSVLRRAKDPALRSRATYNLGNAAYRQGDFSSAAAYYKQAIAADPENEDAAYNLELTLRAMERQKKEQQENPSQPGREDRGESGKGQEKSPGRDGEGKDHPSGEAPSDGPSSAEKKQKDQAPGQGSGGESKGRGKGKGQDSGEGDLRAMKGPGGTAGEERSKAASLSMMDRKKAEALLENMKEDRSRFLRFQVPRDKRDGVSSGKDW
jgi:Ca-activated chloride channel family protein